MLLSLPADFRNRAIEAVRREVVPVCKSQACLGADRNEFSACTVVVDGCGKKEKETHPKRMKGRRAPKLAENPYRNGDDSQEERRVAKCVEAGDKADSFWAKFLVAELAPKEGGEKKLEGPVEDTARCQPRIR